MTEAKPLIIITGKDGQLGRSLQNAAKQFHQFDFLFTNKEMLDITNAENVRQIFKKFNPACCINTAAYTAVDLAETTRVQAFLVNATAVSNLAKTCAELNCPFIHISTDYVFDGKKNARYTEIDSTNPVNYYGFTKKAGEESALNECKKTIVIRASWLYSEFGKNFLKTMLHLFKTKNEISVVGDQFGALTYAGAMAFSLLKICDHIIMKKSFDDFGIYHYCDEGNISWYDFANEIKNQSGATCLVHEITTDEYPTPAKRPKYSVMSTTKIREIFDIEIKNWKENLKVCLKNMKVE